MADKFKVYAENANPVNLMNDEEFASDSQVDQGAKPREVIYSAKINTALRECSLAIKGLFNVLSTTSEGEIGPNSTIIEVQDYLNTALSEKIDTLNAATATKLETTRTVTINGAVEGSFTFDGSADATATMEFNNVGGNEDGEPCYVDTINNRLVGISKLDGNILLAPNDRQHNKLSILKLSNMYKNVGSSDSLFVSGAAEKLTNNLAVDVNVGNSKTPVYFSNGVPVACNLLDSIYPVGSIYMSTSDNSPQNFLGGTWVRIEGQFLLGAGSGYNPGDTGGEATHTLKESEMPRHNHSISAPSSYATGGGGSFLSVEGKAVVRSTQSWSSSGSGGITGIGTDAVGNGNAHNNMPPYLAVYIWKRIA